MTAENRCARNPSRLCDGNLRVGERIFSHHRETSDADERGVKDTLTKLHLLLRHGYRRLTDCCESSTSGLAQSGSHLVRATVRNTIFTY